MPSPDRSEDRVAEIHSPALRLPKPRVSDLTAARLALLLAMVSSGVLVLWMGRGTSFSGDDLYYYARVVNRGLGVVQYHHLSLEYLLAPHNNHLQVTGKLIYEGLFATAGTNYFWYRLVEVGGVVLCVGLFFELARVRVGPWGALAPSILLLFYGYAWEALLWPFDLHTLYALAAGLAALLCLDRPGRWSDPAACLLLVASIATIELGLAFVAAVGVLLLCQRRFSRLWIVAIPAALYGGWYLWARQFHQTAYHVTNAAHLLRSIGEASGAVLGSLLALNPVGHGTPPLTVGTTGWPVLTVLLGAALLIGIWRGPNRPFLWATLTLALVYWLFLGLADRQPDSSRYIFAGSVAVLLLSAEAVRERRLSPLLIGILCLIVAAALPRNIKLLTEGRTAKLDETMLNKVAAGAEQLASRPNPDFLPNTDLLVVSRGGAGPVSISAGQYLSGSERVGPFGYSARQILASPAPLRDLADAVLAHAGGLRVGPVTGPRSSRCREVRSKAAAQFVGFSIPQSGAVVTPSGPSPIQVRARLFGLTGVPLAAELSPGHAITVAVSSTELPRDWEGLVSGPADVCIK
jgi:hypothetical protein